MNQNERSATKPVHALQFRSGIFILFILISPAFRGQQEWQFTQHFFNLYDINSAYAGNHGTASFALRYRNQWPGIAGSPQTQMLSLHSPLKKWPLGAGMRLMHESIGARSTVSIRLSGAYKMKLWGGSLSAGASLGVIREQINLSELSIRDQDDLLPTLDSRSYTMPLAEAAVMFNTTRYWIGTEWTRLNRSRTNWASGGQARMYYHGNTTAGVMIPSGKDDLFKLSGIVRYTEGGFWNYDLTGAYLINNLIWLGAGYRVKSGPLFYSEVNINPRLRLGYSFETGNAREYLPAQAHEIFLGFNPGNQQRSSIRFFQ